MACGRRRPGVRRAHDATRGASRPCAAQEAAGGRGRPPRIRRMPDAARIMIVGLDCVPPEIVFEDMRDELPTLARLMAEGRHGRLRSCEPPITVPAWSCMT